MIVRDYNKSLVNLPGVPGYVRTPAADEGGALEDTNPRSFLWTNAQSTINAPSFNTLFGGSPAGGVTISLWVKWTAQATWRGIFNSSTNSSWNDGIGMHWNAFQRAWAGAFNTSYAQALIANNTWAHVVWRATVGGTVDIIINGTKTSGIAFSGPFTGLNNVIEFGRMKGSATWYIVGLMRLIGIYGSALSDAQCGLLYNGGTAGIPSNLVAGPVAQYVGNTLDDLSHGGTVRNSGTLGAAGNATVNVTVNQISLSTDVP